MNEDLPDPYEPGIANGHLIIRAVRCGKHPASRHRISLCGDCVSASDCEDARMGPPTCPHCIARRDEKEPWHLTHEEIEAEGHRLARLLDARADEDVNAFRPKADPDRIRWRDADIVRSLLARLPKATP